MSLKELLKSNERVIIILLTLLLSIAPFFKPLALPLPTYELTTKAYRKIEELQEGDLVLVSYDFGPGVWVECGNAMNAIVQHLFIKKAKIIMVAFEATGPPLEERTLREIDIGDAKYGEDYVILGFIPGFETGMASFVSDPRMLEKDFYGTPIGDLTIMDDVQSISDFKLYIFACFTWLDPWMRQFSGKFPIISANDASAIPLLIPFIDAGQLYTAVRGARGAAEYEALLGKPGKATKYMDAGSVTGIFAIVLIVVGNIVYLRERNRGRSE